MCTDPVERPSKSTAPAEPPRNDFHPRDIDRVHRARPDDVEGNALRDLTDPEEIGAAAAFRGLTFANVIDQIWHFCSVDYGPKCISVQ